MAKKITAETSASDTKLVAGKAAKEITLSNVKIVNDLTGLTKKFDEIGGTIANIEAFIENLKKDLTLGIAIEEENMAKALKTKEEEYEKLKADLTERMVLMNENGRNLAKAHEEKLEEARKQFARDLEKVAYDNNLATREETEKALLAFAAKVKPDCVLVEKVKLTTLTEASDKLSKDFQAEIGKAVGMAVSAKERELNGAFLTEKNAAAQSIALLTQQNATLLEQLKDLKLQLVEKEGQIKMIPTQIADAVKNAAAPTNVYSGGGK